MHHRELTRTQLGDVKKKRKKKETLKKTFRALFPKYFSILYQQMRQMRII